MDMKRVALVAVEIQPVVMWGNTMVTVRGVKATAVQG